MKKDFEVLDGLLKFSGESFLLSDLLWPLESVFTVSDGSLEVSPKLLLEEMAKVVLFKAWGELSRRELLDKMELFEMELLEMELLPVSGIPRCFAPPPIFLFQSLKNLGGLCDLFLNLISTFLFL